MFVSLLFFSMHCMQWSNDFQSCIGHVDGGNMSF